MNFAKGNIILEVCSVSIFPWLVLFLIFISLKRLFDPIHCNDSGSVFNNQRAEYSLATLEAK